MNGRIRTWLCGGVLAVVALTGCDASLDSFLYRRARVGAYELPAEGDTPEETVAPERLELVDIRVDDRVRLGAVYVHANEAPARGAVIYFHGQCCSLNEHVDRAKRLSNLGYDVLAFDYRGWGTSTDVTPTEAGLLEDSRAALAWVVQRRGVPRERLTYYGRSFGAAVAVQLAEVEPPAALILESPFASVEAFKADATRMDFPAHYVAKDEWDNVARIRNIPSALLLLHGLEDDFVRPEFSEQIFEAANEPKKLVLVEGADHGDVPERMGDAYAETVRAWIAAQTPAP